MIRFLSAAPMLLLAVAGVAQSQPVPLPASPRERPELADVVGVLERIAPFRPQDVEDALNVKLAPDSVGVEGDFLAVGPDLRDGVSITKLDLRRRRQEDGSIRAFLLLSVSGRCISLADMKNKLELTDAATGLDIPHGGSAKLFASSQRSWGKLFLWFSFPEPGCLESIAFQPAETDRRR